MDEERTPETEGSGAQEFVDPDPTEQGVPTGPHTPPYGYRYGAPPGYPPPPREGSRPGYGPGYGHGQDYGFGYGHAAGYGWQAGAAAPPPPPPPYGTPAAAGRPRRRTGIAAGAIAAAVLLAGAAGGLIGHSVDHSPRSGSNDLAGTSHTGAGKPSGSSSTTPGSGTGSSGSGALTPAADAAKVDPGLVDVDTVIDYGEAEGAGTGMVLTSDGLVLTNNHVVEGATSIKVTDIGNGQTYSATVVGYDVSKDVALLRLQAASGLRTVTIASSSSVTSGERVVGIGNAGGTGGTPHYASGTITGTDKSLTASDELTGTSEQLSGMIATNADIQAGDSGGPLVDSSGRVIGMDTAGTSTFQVASQASTEGFAVPIDTAMGVVRQIESGTGSATVHVGTTAFLGVQISPSGSGGGFDPFGGGGDVNGATISGVVNGGPAAAAGLTGGDVITSVGGHAVTSDTSLQQVLVGYERPGDRVTIQYTDASGAQQSATVVLATGPAA